MRVSSSAMLTSPPKKASAVGTRLDARESSLPAGIEPPSWNDAVPPAESPKGLATYSVRDGKFRPRAPSSALHASRATVAISVSAVAAEAAATRVPSAPARRRTICRVAATTSSGEASAPSSMRMPPPGGGSTTSTNVEAHREHVGSESDESADAGRRKAPTQSWHHMSCCASEGAPPPGADAARAAGRSIAARATEPAPDAPRGVSWSATFASVRVSSQECV